MARAHLSGEEDDVRVADRRRDSTLLLTAKTAVNIVLATVKGTHFERHCAGEQWLHRRSEAFMDIFSARRDRVLVTRLTQCGAQSR